MLIVINISSEIWVKYRFLNVSKTIGKIIYIIKINTLWSGYSDWRTVTAGTEPGAEQSQMIHGEAQYGDERVTMETGAAAGELCRT